MAYFNEQGLGELRLTLEELADLPEDVEKEMLLAEGEVARRYQQEELEALKLVDTHALKDSLRVRYKNNPRHGRYVLVHPVGERGTYNRKLQIKSYKNSKSGRTYELGGDVKANTNNDVGFVWEFGAPDRGLPSLQWMRIANEKAADEANAAAAEVYQCWVDSLGL